MTIAEFCTWCREYVVNGNRKCEECRGCLECRHFEDGCCLNEMVVSEYRKEWHRSDHILGIGPPLCRKYCPYLSEAERDRARTLAEGEGADDGGNSAGIRSGEDERDHRILFTPLPKFWLSDSFECITFEANFSETLYYHMVLLGWCECEAPEYLTVEIPEC